MGNQATGGKACSNTEHAVGPTQRKWRALLGLGVGLMLLVLFFPSYTEPHLHGKPLSRWMELNGYSAAAVEEALNHLGPELTPFLVQWVRRGNSLVRTVEEPMWNRLPPSFQKHFPELKPPNYQALRRAGLLGLSRLGPYAQEALPAVLRVLQQEQDWELRSWALTVLGDMGVDSEPVLRVLLEHLQSDDLRLQAAAVAALGQLGQKAEVAVPRLIQLLEQPVPGNTATAIQALGQIGPAASPALPLLLQQARASGQQEAVLKALKGLGSQARSALPWIMQVVERGPQQLRLVAMETLMHLGSAAQPALPALQAALQDTNAMVRVMALGAMRTMETALPQITSGLLQVLQETNTNQLTGRWTFQVSSNRWVPGMGLDARMAAGWFLGDLGPAAAEALPSLRLLLKESRNWLQVIAARAVWKIQGHAQEVLPVLSNALQHPDPMTQLLALRVLQEMQATPEALLPVLKAVEESVSWEVYRELVPVQKRLMTASKSAFSAENN